MLDGEGSPLRDRKQIPAAFYLKREAEIWLFAFRAAEPRGLFISGSPVNNAFLDKLAAILSSDISLLTSSPRPRGTSAPKTEAGRHAVEDATGRQVGGDIVLARGTYSPPQREASGSEVANEPSLWRKPIHFGISQLEVLEFDEGAFKKRSIEIEMTRSLAATAEELFSASNPPGLVILGALAALAVVFFILEILALMFGLRISGGITSAIRTLHRHMCCVTEGDLEARIDIPNEDELGDLAASFNQMTEAIKRGREEAIARERLEKELETARAIQERLLPRRIPSVPGFDVSGTSLPSQEVGGDYFDFLDLETGHLAVAIADVSGKGMPAALLMANLQASLHAQELRLETVADIPARLNTLLVRSTDERNFITFFYGILDRGKATFTYTNSGHNPPLLVRADGRVERLEEGGMILGFLVNQSYAQATVVLDPGDVLVLFTDGITEASNPEAEGRAVRYFGEERLLEVIRKNASCSAAEIQSAVLRAVAEHIKDGPQGDDITLVVIKRTRGQEAVVYVS